MANAPAGGSSGFDFLIGKWDVRHRKLRKRLSGSSDWIEFPGKLDVRSILGGLGNIDENDLRDPSDGYLASSLRVYFPQSQTWSIWWIDGRSGELDKPVTGRFEGRIGRFFNDDMFEGRPIRVRFTYEDLGGSRARWDQAFSPDGGVSWETNWTMDFVRTGKQDR